MGKITTGTGKTHARPFVGARLRRLRSEQGLSQIALAGALGISPSYLNQIEHDARPMTAKVLAKITERFGVDDGFFDAQDDMRLIAELREALFDDDVDAPAEATDAQAISGLVASHPAMAQAMVNLHRRYRIVTDQLAAATDERGDRSRRGTITAPHEEVRDFFYQRRNYIHELDVAAEEMTSRMRMHSADIRRGIAQRLSDAHGVTIVTRVDMGDHVLHNFDPETRRLDISNALSAGGRTFRLAADEVPDLIALLRHGLDEGYDAARERVERLERPYQAG